MTPEMAKAHETALANQVGSLVLQISSLSVQLAFAQTENAKLKAELEAMKKTGGQPKAGQ